MLAKFVLTYDTPPSTEEIRNHYLTSHMHNELTSIMVLQAPRGEGGAENLKLGKYFSGARYCTSALCPTISREY